MGKEFLIIALKKKKALKKIYKLNFRSSPEKMLQLLHDAITFTLDFANDLSFLHIH